MRRRIKPVSSETLLRANQLLAAGAARRAAEEAAANRAALERQVATLRGLHHTCRTRACRRARQCLGPGAVCLRENR